MLVGREAEQAVVAELLAGVRAGTSGVLVLRGEPGIGKTALLSAAAELAAGTPDDLRVLRGAGVESEAELPFAGLHLLLRPLLDRLGSIPEVQAEALGEALGLGRGTGTGDPFLVGLAVLSLLSEAAPVLCLVDDAQWLDRASANALIFAARRLDSEGVGMLFAARNAGFAPAGLRELHLTGLDTTAAITLLDRQSTELTREARYRILAEAAGNPLALVELPHAARVSSTLPLTDRLRETFESQVRDLPESTQRLLLLAALEDSNDIGVILTAAKDFGASVHDLDRAEQAGLVQVPDGETLSFRHPLIRAAVQQGAALSRRMAAHAALAGALDPVADPDRRAWHRAMATTGTDDEIAAELERTAIRAGRRSGHAAAAAAYERAARLTAEPAARVRRYTLAAEATAEAGDLDRAAQMAESLGRPDDPELVARLALVRGVVAFLRGSTQGVHRLLLDGAEAVVDSDPDLAALLLVEAVQASWYGVEDTLAESLDRLTELYRRMEPGAPQTELLRLLLYAVFPIAGRDAEKVDDPSALLARTRGANAGDVKNLGLIAALGIVLGQDRASHEITSELAVAARRDGRIGLLPAASFYLATTQLYLGRHDDAAATTAEALAIARDTGQQRWAEQFSEVRGYLAAIAGDEAECRKLADDALAQAGGRAVWNVPWTYGALGLLDLGLGRAEAALTRLLELNEGRARFHIIATRSTPDLVEAAVRVGRPEAAEGPLALYRQWGQHAKQPWIEALAERCLAMLASDDDAEEHYAAALRLHGQDVRVFEQARTRLLFGEWLRRVRRKSDARAQLRAAQETFERLGATPWSERARSELTATGVPGAAAAQEHTSGVAALLTPQELQIVRLAAQGMSNKDIAAQLFLSPRTVGHHLYKAYPKLGIVSRGELPGLPLDS